MRRTIFLALFAALLLAPSAHSADWITILRDCADDGALQGNYSTAELRNARKNIPTDVDEYGDCRDVLASAIAAKVAKNDTSGGTGTGGGGSSSAGGGEPTGGTGQTDSAGGGSPAPGGYDPAGVLVPSTPADNQALADAAKSGSAPVQLGSGAVPADAAKMSATIGRNGIPGTLALLLILLALAAATTAVPAARRLVLARLKP